MQGRAVKKEIALFQKPLVSFSLVVFSVLALSGCASNKELLRDLDSCRADSSRCEEDLLDSKNRIAGYEQDLESEQASRVLSERRMTAYRDIAAKLRWAFEPSELDIVLREGKMVLRLPNKILFDIGKANLRNEGEETLHKIAEVLKTAPDRHFLVAGHTCNIPVNKKNKRFKSNRELSTLRALMVVNYLESNQVDPKQLGVLGYGEHYPENGNESEEDRQQNRRTEIIFMPKIDEIPKMPKDI